MPALYIHIGIDPVAFHIGPAAVHWYGICYVVAILVSLFFCSRYLANRGLTSQQLDTVAPLAIAFGFIGGRLYYVVQNNFVHFLTHPFDIIAVWNGGMAFFGAIFGGALGVFVYAWRKHWPLAPMCDVAAMFGLMGQPIGRIGNIINGDIRGYPTHLPWGFVYTNPNSLAPSHTIAYQPAAVYEMLCNFALIAILYPLRNRVRPGWFAIFYLAGYCVTQILVFFWRGSEPILYFGLKQAQLTSIPILAVVIAFAAFLYWRGYRPFGDWQRPTPPETAPSGVREPSH